MKKISLTIAGNTKADKAHEIWYKKLSPVQRYEIMQKVGIAKSTRSTLTACLTYVANNLDKY